MKAFKFLFIAILLISGCKSVNKPGDTKLYDTSDTYIQEKINSVVFAFPSSMEMLTYMEDERFTYQEKLLNPVESANSYLNSKKQALNLGVYLTDMGYCNIFGNTKESSHYMETVLLLSEKLNIVYPRNDPVFIKLERNRNDIDSLKSAIASASTFLSNWMLDNGFPHVFAVMSYGTFIEFMYITINSIGEYAPHDASIQKLAELKYSVENLSEFFNTIETNYNYSLEDIDIKKLTDIFNQIEGDKTKAKVEKTENGKLSFSGGEKLSMTEEQYDLLKNTVTKLRSEIISIEN